MSNHVEGINNAPISDGIHYSGDSSVGKPIRDSILAIGSKDSMQAISQDTFHGFEVEIRKIAGAMNDFISGVNCLTIDFSSAALAMIDPDAYDGPETKTEGSPDTKRAHQEEGGPSMLNAEIEACAKKFYEMGDDSAKALNDFCENLVKMWKVIQAEQARVGDDASKYSLELDALGKKFRSAHYVVRACRKHLDELTSLSAGLARVDFQSDKRAAMTLLAQFLKESFHSVGILIEVDKLSDGAGVRNNNLPGQRINAEDKQISELRKMSSVCQCVIERLPQYGIDDSAEEDGRYKESLDYLLNNVIGDLEKVRHSPVKRASDIYHNSGVGEYRRKIAGLEGKIHSAVLDLISVLGDKGEKSDERVHLAKSIVREEFNRFEAMRGAVERKIDELSPQMKTLREGCDDQKSIDEISKFEDDAHLVMDELKFAMEGVRWADDLARKAGNSAVGRWIKIGTLNNVRKSAVEKIVEPLQHRVTRLATMCQHMRVDMQGVAWQDEPNAVRLFSNHANVLKGDVERLEEDIDSFVGHKAFRGWQPEQLIEVQEVFADLRKEVDELMRAFNHDLKGAA